MSLSSASQVGQIIGGLVNENQSLKEDLVADEQDQSIILSPLDEAEVTSRVVLTKPELSGEAFVLDHPVYSELNNSSYKLSGLYSDDLNEGLVAFYNLCGDADDSVGSNNGSLEGDASYAEGVEGYYMTALSLDGTSDGVSLSPVFAGDQDPITISAWVYTRDISTQKQAIFGEYNSSNEVRNYFSIDDSGYINFDQYTPSGGAALCTTPLVEDVWTHVVMTKSSNSCSFYINGSFVNSVTHTETYSGGAITVSGIGCRYSGVWNTNEFKGSISSVGLWTKALSSDEIERLYMEGYVNDHPLKSGELISVYKS